METKDIFYILGISSTIILSSITLFVNLKNRRNFLREYLYKEQIIFFQKLFKELDDMNSEFDKVFNFKYAKKDNKYQEILENIAQIIYHNEFLLPNELNNLLKQLIKESHGFYVIQLGENIEKREKSYKDYYNKYFELLDYVKKFIGTNNLSTENLKLHRKSNSTLSKILRKQFNEILENKPKYISY